MLILTNGKFENKFFIVNIVVHIFELKFKKKM